MSSPIISFRPASRVKREIHHDWLENDFKDIQPATFRHQNCACWRDFVWNGQDEDERPLSKNEMLSGIAVARKRRSRPAGSGTKEQVALRLDHEVLAAFRRRGPGWQTRMNEALKDWLRTHSAV